MIRTPPPARLRRDHLGVEASDPRIAGAVEAAKLDAGAGDPAGPWPLLGLLAAGRFHEARSALRRVERHARLARAHYLGWTGDLGALDGGWAELRGTYGPLVDPARTAAAVIQSDDPLHASWAAFAEGRTEEAARMLSAGLDDEPAPAAVLTTVVYGLLGAEPDAALGRLRLRPQVPDAWDRLNVRRLKIAEVDLALHYRRESGTHTFRIEQTGGAVPLTLVFEPALPGDAELAATVDGRPADLERRAFGDRVVRPLQIALDHERVIEFRG